jgi:GT2 family glycosyltransferase
LVSRISDVVTFPNYPTARCVRTLPGVNISYKRRVVERVGLQDVALFRGEDVDYNWRVQKLGYSIYYDPAVRVRHQHRSSWRALLEQHYMYGRAYYRLRGKWREMYSVYPHQLRHPKDVLKGVNFFAAILYEPLRSATRMQRTHDKFLAFPLMLALQVVWRGGILREKFSSAV